EVTSMSIPDSRETPAHGARGRAVSEIRREHEVLRAHLDEIQALLTALERGDHAAVGPLRQRALACYERLRDHIDREEHLLAPFLQARGDDGARQAELLEREHEEQRELLGFLAERLRQPRPTVLLVRELHGFLACLRDDMAGEEATILEAVVR